MFGEAEPFGVFLGHGWQGSGRIFEPLRSFPAAGQAPHWQMVRSFKAAATRRSIEWRATH
jgi:hypothetical protein